MNSALKPVLPQPGVPQPGGQASPAKANVANINHAVGLPQGAQNSLHIGTNNLVGQNLTLHAPVPPQPPHAVPSMAPVSANMAQMAQNMSHHGNLSHVTQNSVAPTNMAASPSKSATTSSPLSLVSDKIASVSQPLALTRTPEKKEPDSTGQSNGIESPKSGANAPTTLKPEQPEADKNKQDTNKALPSTPKPPEKPSSAPPTSQKMEPANPAGKTDSLAQPKVATANEPTEKSVKPIEPKPAPTADVAPTQSDHKPVPESANDSQLQEKAPKLKIATPATPAKQEAPVAESAKTEPPKPEDKDKVDAPTKEEKPANVEDNKEEAVPEPAKVEPAEKPVKVDKVDVVEKVEEKKPEPKMLAKPEVTLKATPKSTMKLATVTPPMRKRRQASPSKSSDGPSSAKKLAEGDATPDSRTKRNRTKVQLYQSPTPELAMATKLSASAGRSTPTKPNDDKLIVFYKNEYLAVRNAEGGFYVCQAMQNVYRTTRKIKIRWLSQDKAADASGETYKPDFYDVTDMECVLTTLSLVRAGGGGAQVLKPAEQARAKSILERALKAEQSGAKNLELTEEHPDGLDLSLFTDESQLEKGRKRRGSKSSPRKSDADSEIAKEATPPKKAQTTPKRSPKSARKAQPPPPKAQTPNNKRKSPGSTPIVAAASKTATAVTEKAPAKAPPPKRAARPPAPAPAASPTRAARRAAAKDSKPSPIVPTPSTSTGKSTRTPRKPPAKK